jgi:hypothetical protein
MMSRIFLRLISHLFKRIKIKGASVKFISAAFDPNVSLVKPQPALGAKTIFFNAVARTSDSHT